MTGDALKRYFVIDRSLPYEGAVPWFQVHWFQTANWQQSKLLTSEWPSSVYSLWFQAGKMQAWVRLAWWWSRPVSVHLEDRLELLRRHSSLPSMSLFWNHTAVIAVLCSTLTGCVCYHTYSLAFSQICSADAEMTPAQCWVKVLKSWIIGFENEPPWSSCALHVWKQFSLLFEQKD